MHQPKISIIILNYKTYGLLRHCLRSIVSFAPKEPIEILVVDAVSNTKSLTLLVDEIQEIILQTDIPSNITLTTIALPDNQGYARANNRALQRAKGEYLLVLNADTLVFENTLESMISYMDTHNDIGMLGPLVTNPDGSRQHSCFRFPELLYPLYRRTALSKTKKGRAWVSWFVMDGENMSEPRAVDWLMGVCVMVRAQALSDVGMLDERFFLFLEDTDWCYRFWQHGWRIVYYPKTHIVHYPHRASSGSNLLRHMVKKTAWIHLVSWCKYYAKHMLGNRHYHRTGR